MFFAARCAFSATARHAAPAFLSVARVVVMDVKMASVAGVADDAIMVYCGEWRCVNVFQTPSLSARSVIRSTLG